MNIGIIGTRGFPGVQGGIETHCMELYTRIALNNDSKITVYRRSPYINSENRNIKYRNIKFVDINVPRSKNLETFLHSFFSTIHALFSNYDIVHFHNTGPGFFIPLLKYLTRTRIIFTYHNISYTQKKWNFLAKGFLTFSERISLKYSDCVIFVSDILKDEMLAKYNLKNYRVISNGVNLPQKSLSSDFIDSLGLERNKYIIAVGRFLEEKGFDYLIRAYKKADIKAFKLVIVGDTDYPTEYSERLKSLAKENNIILTGFIKGEKLNQIYSFARLFVMSSYEEGMPIALLEAMSYNIDVLSTNILPALKVKLENDDYFLAGDEEDLKSKIIKKLGEIKERNFSEILSSRYNWDTISKETFDIFNEHQE